jgi:hypothetical protein
LRDSQATGTAFDLISAAFLQHKVAWMCLGIAAWHLIHAKRVLLRTSEILAMAPAVTLAVMSWESWPWFGLALSLAFLLRIAGKSDASIVAGLLIGIALAMHQALVPLIAQLAGDGVLAIDARIAGALAGLAVADLSISGTVLQSDNGHSVILVWGCSSLSQIGEVMLFCASLCSLAPRHGRPHRVVLAGSIAFAAAGAVLLNTLRLALIVTSPEVFAYIHDGSGATFFRLAALGVSVVAAGGYHWSCAIER